MTDFTAQRLTLLNAKFCGRRVSDKRNGQTGTVTRVHVYFHWGPGNTCWSNGLHFVVKLDAGGTMIANLNQVVFC